MASQREIKESLVRQLEAQNKATAYALEKVDEYMALYRIRKKLEQDIRRRGVKVTEYDSKGQAQIRTNGSVQDLVKATASGNQILSLLGLHQPVRQRSDDDYT